MRFLLLVYSEPGVIGSAGFHADAALDSKY